MEEQKALLMRHLKTRIGKDGVLRVISRQTRSQAANRELAVERFVELLQDAARQVPIRKKTQVSKGAKLRRLEEKKQQSMLKKERSKRVPVKDLASELIGLRRNFFYHFHERLQGRRNPPVSVPYHQ